MINTVKIGNIPFKVLRAHAIPSDTPERGNMALGEVYYHKAEIYLEDDLPPAMKRPMLMHEIIHVLLEQSGQAMATSEDTITALGYSITALIQNNPELVRYLCHVDCDEDEDKADA